MSAITSFSSIVTPSSSSNSLSTFLPNNSNSFTHFPPTPSKLLFKTLTLKPHNFTPSPLSLAFPLHLSHCAAASIFDDIETETSDDEVQVETEVSEIKGNDQVKVVDDVRVYVGNLPFSMTTSQLSEIFSRAGQVKSIEVIYDKRTERSRGFGFVTMESVDEAKEVIRMFNGSEVGGRTIRVNFPEVPKGGEQKTISPRLRISNQSFVDTPHKVYAGNLSWAVTTQGLRNAFSDQPGFSSAKVIYERDGGRSRGFGFVSFQLAEAAQSAISAMEGVELEGRPLRMNIAADKGRSNAETATDQSEVLSAVSS